MNKTLLIALAIASTLLFSCKKEPTPIDPNVTLKDNIEQIGTYVGEKNGLPVEGSFLKGTYSIKINGEVNFSGTWQVESLMLVIKDSKYEFVPQPVEEEGKKLTLKTGSTTYVLKAKPAPIAQ